MDILITGRFDSDNWILAHLGPLSASKECSRIWMVSTNPVPQLEKIEPIYPPKWLIKIAGTTQARILVFLWEAIRKRPHIVGGFHIMPNGIAVGIAGRLAGAKSMYFCVGGPAEILGGGAYSSDSYFKKMETPDPVVEKRLLKIVSEFDIIITMGKGAVKFFQENGVKSDFQVVSGGIDTNRFKLINENKTYDCIMTGRLVEIKRIDIFLQAIKLVADKIPGIKVAIAGDGKLLRELKKIACDLKIDNNVDFAGHQNNVEYWLQKSKIFVLTSDSEGLSLSMMEAMTCGLPVIVSDVGDLGDLVENGVNGYLVPRRRPDLFAERLMELLSDGKKLESFSNAASQSASRYSMKSVVQQWDNILSGYSENKREN
jgi:glycosyltransferase involved in cell wall biosynthesis